MKVSVIICTHNPARPVFARCLEAVDRLKCDGGVELEVILVDNQSSPPLAGDEVVAGFLKKRADRILICESQMGLTFARLAGFHRSCGQWVIFFDDDNFPEPDYLQGVVSLARKYPEVGVWGPGIVEVVWGEGVGNWAKSWDPVFQGRRREEVKFGRVAGWPDYYPAGTGMVVQRAILETYAESIERGLLSAQDRCGESLTSGGDGQIVWTGVKMGLAAGISPELHLQHFTARRKARLKYVLRLVFGVMSSGSIALTESFPEELEKMRESLSRLGNVNAMVVRKFLYLVGRMQLRSGPVVMAELLGELHGKHVATGTPLPLVLRLAERWLS